MDVAGQFTSIVNIRDGAVIEHAIDTTLISTTGREFQGSIAILEDLSSHIGITTKGITVDVLYRRTNPDLCQRSAITKGTRAEETTMNGLHITPIGNLFQGSTISKSPYTDFLDTGACKVQRLDGRTAKRATCHDCQVRRCKGDALDILIILKHITIHGHDGHSVYLGGNNIRFLRIFCRADQSLTRLSFTGRSPIALRLAVLIGTAVVLDVVFFGPDEGQRLTGRIITGEVTMERQSVRRPVLAAPTFVVLSPGRRRRQHDERQRHK